jgi:eukaryotic-like serine/threonine-protein kinase
MADPGSVVLGRRYALAERIGAGGGSEVWRATDLVLSRQVAVKLLHLADAPGSEALTRFRAEARHAGGLSHENIARVYDYAEPDPPQPPFLVMELVAGPSLAGTLAGGPLDPAHSMDIVAQAAAGLSAAHRAGLLHRDVKPANLLLAPGGIVKITDFGIARAAGSAPVTRTGQLVGTPAYLAPERVVGASATPASDLYALGVVAYECLAGAPPFTGHVLAVALAHRERPLPPLPGWVPAEVAALVAELTAKDPARRPGSADAVRLRAARLAARAAAPAVAITGPGVGYPVIAASTAEPPTQQLSALPAGTTGHGPRSWHRPRGLAARPGAAAAAAVAVVVAVVAAVMLGSVIEPGPALRAGTIPSATPSAPTRPAQSPIVEVRAAALIGQPVAAAARRLRQRGLSVRIRWRRSGEQPPGAVLSVRPAGPRPVGSTVTLVAAVRPARAGDGGNGQDRHGGHGDGNGGQGGGDGGPGGGDGGPGGGASGGLALG